MHELSQQVSIVIYFLLSCVGLCRDSKRCCFMNLDYHKDWGGIVPSQDFINIDVCLLDGGASAVPSDNLLFGVDLAHHIVHSFMIDMVEKPNIWLLQVFFKWHCVAISHI